MHAWSCPALYNAQARTAREQVMTQKQSAEGKALQNKIVKHSRICLQTADKAQTCQASKKRTGAKRND
jgi:hypothetical protein